MKGLIFNLLQTLARESECSDEAWELVAEFAASENFPASGPDGVPQVLDTHPPGAFDVPAEAMLRCLRRDAETPSDLNVFELEGPAPDLTFAVSDALEFDSSLLVIPQQPGLGPSFAQALLSLPSVDEDPERDTNATLDAMYSFFGRSSTKQ